MAANLPSTTILTRSQSRKRKTDFGQIENKEENDSGFRFSRQSKRLRQKDKKSSDNKDNAKEVKRRRSSFIRGRKIHSPLEICQPKRVAAVQDLYKEIPTDLSPDGTLLQLFDKSLLHMCENAKDEKYINIPNFAEKVKQIVLHLQTTLKNSDVWKCAAEQKCEVIERVIVPNPKAQQLEEYAKKSQETTERMSKEEKGWEEILEKYQNEVPSTERELIESYGQISKDCLSAEQNVFLESIQPDKDMFDNLDRLKNESILMIDKIATTALTVKAINDAAKQYLEDVKESPSSMSTCETETPRRLIHAITK
ncbi:uncharacterized protein LOC114518964 [Dendronephthya gigantea]|uniref:uncharacterized protein LOC114518964 n=1 Tax=Dendronephthya gigantea TaxID=151771 RepID=UPI00106B7F10|nr:uncharacterized protein LOC114518964 [Dendronephthya gigantea]